MPNKVMASEMLTFEIPFGGALVSSYVIWVMGSEMFSFNPFRDSFTFFQVT